MYEVFLITLFISKINRFFVYSVKICYRDIDTGFKLMKLFGKRHRGRMQNAKVPTAKKMDVIGWSGL